MIAVEGIFFFRILDVSLEVTGIHFISIRKDLKIYKMWGEGKVRTEEKKSWESDFDDTMTFITSYT